MNLLEQDTIAAIATATGFAGIGIVRVSGMNAAAIATAFIGFKPRPRHAHFTEIRDAAGCLIDQGIVLFFPAPHSFTGEDVVEFQVHGGPRVLDRVLHTAVRQGARLASAGEFSLRAFLNNKIDLAQAEAIHDLIHAETEKSASSSIQSLKGEFSLAVNALRDSVMALRIQIEAMLDFPDEEIDDVEQHQLMDDLRLALQTLENIYRAARQGHLLREGISVAIIGRPNAGKSSILNALTGRDSAIVTTIAGTTRDLLSETIQIDGLPLHIIDTAGIRDDPDEVEAIGIERAREKIAEADHVLLVVDNSDEGVCSAAPAALWPEHPSLMPGPENLTVIRNKADLNADPIAVYQQAGYFVVNLSATEQRGIDLLRKRLLDAVGFQSEGEGVYTARRRHLICLQKTEGYLVRAFAQLEHCMLDIVAEDLRGAQETLGEITGAVTSDDLLGEIFSSFCIGK